MLILTREDSQSIQISDNILLTVVAVYCHSVLIHISNKPYQDIQYRLQLDSKADIADGITVKLSNIERRQAKLGIEAPKHVRIMRTELLDDAR